MESMVFKSKFSRCRYIYQLICHLINRYLIVFFPFFIFTPCVCIYSGFWVDTRGEVYFSLCRRRRRWYTGSERC